MADFNFTSNTGSPLDELNASLNMNADIFGEESTNENHETISESGEGVTQDAVVGNIPINNDNDPFMGLGALTTNFNYDPSLPISDGNDPFVGSFAANDNFNPVHGQTQTQQGVQEGVSFDPTNQAAANFLGVTGDYDWLNLTSEQQDEDFQRLMEMSPEDFEAMMRSSSSATPYAISKKRVRRDEDFSAPNTVESATLASQPAFEPQQIHQIRQIREAKSRRGKAIEALQKKAQDLEVDLAKSRAEVNDAFENGRMATLLGLNGEWEAKEAKIKADADFELQKQVGAVRTFLEGQIAEGKGREEELKREANSALAQQRDRLEEANRQIAEKNEKLDEFRAEAEAWKTNVEGEAGTYKQAAEAEMGAQKEALKAAERANNRLESDLSEKTRALALAKPYVEGLEKKVADLGRLEEANRRAEDPRADQQKLLEESQSYAKDLEQRLAGLEKEQSSQKAAQRRREEELQHSGAEACKALEGKIEDLQVNAEKAARAKESFAQAAKGLNEELRRVSGDLEKVHLALKVKTEELEKVRSALEEQADGQNPQQPRDTPSIFGPVEQVNIKPSEPARARMPSVVGSFTFVTDKELPPSLIESRKIHATKSRRQLPHQHQPTPQPQPQPEPKSGYKQEQEQEPEPKPAPPSRSGMFSRHVYPSTPAYRPRRSHIHALEAIRNRLHIPLGKVHTIVSKLDQVGDWQDGMAEEKAGLIIASELTGLSIEDLKVMQSLRTGIPGSSRRPRKVMSSAQLEIPRTLVDLLATNDRPAIRAFLDGASFPEPQASNDIERDTESRGTQTEAFVAEAEGGMDNATGQEEVAVVLPTLQQTRGSGFASVWKIAIFLCLLWLAATWLFEDPDPNTGWFDYVPEPSPWANLFADLSSWPLISKLVDIFFDQPDLESKWCGNIPMG